MVHEKFQNHQSSDRQSVAQAVVDQIRQLHYSGFDFSYGRTTCRQIENITLLVRDLSVISGSQESSGQTTPTNFPFGNRPLPQLSISVEAKFAADSSDEPSPNCLNTKIDNDRTLTDRMTNISLSENNLVDDSSQTVDDEKEIDAYIYFSFLLEAYNEKNETKKEE